MLPPDGHFDSDIRHAPHRQHNLTSGCGTPDQARLELMQQDEMRVTNNALALQQDSDETVNSQADNFYQHNFEMTQSLLPTPQVEPDSRSSVYSKGRRGLGTDVLNTKPSEEETLTLKLQAKNAHHL